MVLKCMHITVEVTKTELLDLCMHSVINCLLFTIVQHDTNFVPQN